MQSFSNFALFGVGAFLLFLAYKSYKRNWKGTTSVCASAGLVAIMAMQPWVQGFIKTNIMSKIRDYGERLNTFQTTVGKVEEEVNQHQQTLDSHQDELNKQQENLKAIHTLSLKNQDDFTAKIATAASEIQAAQKKIAEASAEMEKQKKELADVQYLVKNLFSAMETESFEASSKDRLYICENHDGIQGRKFIILFKLRHVPIKGSVRLQYHLFPQPPGSYAVANNIIYLGWGDSREVAEAKPFYVEYVADPTRENAVVKTLEVVDEKTMQLRTDNVIEPFSLPRDTK